jgi:hypothetical protein
MSYEYEGAHTHTAPHNAKTHNRGARWANWQKFCQFFRQLAPIDVKSIGAHINLPIGANFGLA